MKRAILLSWAAGVATLVGLAGCLGGCSAKAGQGEVITVPCVNGHAIQAFPGESWEEIEATVWVASPDGDGGQLESTADNAGEAVVTDGQVDVTCYVAHPPQNIPSQTSVQLYVE